MHVYECAVESVCMYMCVRVCVGGQQTEFVNSLQIHHAMQCNAMTFVYSGKSSKKNNQPADHASPHRTTIYHLSFSSRFGSDSDQS